MNNNSKRHNRLTKDIIKGIRKDYIDGLSYKDIIDKYNVSNNTIIRYTKELRDKGITRHTILIKDAIEWCIL